MDEKAERKKFEKWARNHPGNTIDTRVTEWGTDWWYTDHRTKDLWYGWKSRAALGRAAEPSSGHMCGMQGFDGMKDLCPACEENRRAAGVAIPQTPKEPT
jgi:hypothetical protein